MYGGKTSNQLGALRAHRSKQTVTRIEESDVDSQRAAYITKRRAEMGRREPDLSALYSRPEGGTRVEIGKAR